MNATLPPLPAKHCCPSASSDAGHHPPSVLLGKVLGKMGGGEMDGCGPSKPMPWWVGITGGRRGRERKQCFWRKSPDGEQRPCWWLTVAGVTAFVNWWNIR
ncbi:hypothetical protein FH972_003472 [Carpinus fangiana]|uniref:Uncharacterized protein n=1 Tax=Carpinus fangiana TaxID=176857 RepID=A0A5N6QKS9_9ROSI|nr:hypothetical protein FH972_003472 [Carpinus fangiana]